MKMLVGAACIAVIAAVGYYFAGEYSKAQAREAYAERQSTISGCQTIADLVPNGSAAKRCRKDGYIN